MLDVLKIRAVLDEAGKLDMDYRAFGTEVHLHLLRQPLPLKELEAWEEQAGVALPEDYKTYLTCLGNGGAGPAYGLPSFQPPDPEFLRRPCVYSKDQEKAYRDMIQKYKHWDATDEWELYLEYFPNSPGRDDSDWQENHKREWSEQLEKCLDRDIWEPMLYNGQMYLANAGCTMDLYLILNGSHRGFVHCCDTDSAYDLPSGFSQYCKEELTQDFAAYYMEYVNEIEDFLRNMPSGKRRRAEWERAQVRDFLAAMKESDWEGVKLALTAMGDSRELSKKTRSLIHQYEKPLMQAFPEDKAVWKFLDGAYGSWNSYGYPNEPISFREDGGRWRNPRQHFDAFVQTFYD